VVDAPSAKASGVDILRTVIWAGAGVVLGLVGIQTSNAMEELSETVTVLRREFTGEVTNLRIALERLSSKVEMLPPPDLLLRLEILEEHMREVDAQHRTNGKGHP